MSSSASSTRRGAGRASSSASAAPTHASGLPGPEALGVPTALLGGITPEAFMQKYWQKKPLLIRQAIPGVQSPIDRAALFALAEKDDVESRLIVQNLPDAKPKKAGKKGEAEAGWSLAHGPFERKKFPPLKQPGWTLLVQGLDLHVPAAHDILQRFRFVPDARLDDLMISYATEQGGVGPHFDSYDVFLLQVSGKRRWRIGPLKDDSLQPNVPLKILTNFVPQYEWVLEPGDMLYLPPRWAHDGVAEGGECMTCSIGFRVPEATELAREVLVRWAEGVEEPTKRKLYTDPKQEATETPALMPADLQAFTTEAIARLLKDPDAMQSALGEILTEPKPKVWFDIGDPLPEGAGIKLDPRTRMLYDDRRVFANGESWRAAGKDAKHLRALADQRWLDAKAVASVSDALRELLDQWTEDGWAHPL